MNSKQKIKFFKKLFKKSWMTQGGSGCPFYVDPTLISGFYMKKNLGFNYSSFLAYYKNDYAEVSYSINDLKNNWKTLKNRIEEDRSYLGKIRSKSHELTLANELYFKKVRSYDLNEISNQELLKHFKKSNRVIANSINFSHSIEIISAGLEEDLLKYLSGKYSDFEAKGKLAELQNYYKPSFVNKEDQDLLKLKNLKGKRLKNGLEKHLEKYYWIMANYAGAEELDVKFFHKRMKQTKEGKSKRIVIPKLTGDKEYLKFVEQIVEVADWQDHRKINIFKAIYHAQKIVREVARRTKVSVIDIHYLSIFELANLKSLEEIKKMEKVFKERREGCVTWISPNKEIIASGKDFKILEKFYHAMKDKEVEGQTAMTFRGNSANKGKVTGNVCICKSVRDLKKVKEGDIIVASMTRPEFMIALKKARGIITDEGGLTCHAAIVSRELDIPCIIGTKVATKMLKDGDLVEVNANHGVITILKK